MDKKQNIASYIDHTLLRATATEKDIDGLCEEAIQHHFYAVCVHGLWVSRCFTSLQNAPIAINIASVVGFPLGANDSIIKCKEADLALQHGAGELDMVIQLGWLKAGNWQACQHEIEQIKRLTGNKRLKVIIECCYLSETEKKIATQLCIDSGADFVKTSTGFGTGGATLQDIRLLKQAADGQIKIKASGGILNYTAAVEYIEAGADRIGTSNGVKIARKE